MYKLDKGVVGGDPVVLLLRSASRSQSAQMARMAFERAGTGRRQCIQSVDLGAGLDVEEASAIIKDETVCIRCGLCAERCPTGAITMERFLFKEVPTCQVD